MASRTPAPAPDEEVVVATIEVADEDVQRLADAMAATPIDPVDRTLTWPHEVQVAYAVPHVARGNIAGQLLQAAKDLGYPPAAIRSQSDGFLVPLLVYYHLFPSQIPAPADNDE